MKQMLLNVVRWFFKDVLKGTINERLAPLKIFNKLLNKEIVYTYIVMGERK